MAGVVGVPEGEGTWLSPRTVDNAASGPPRSRAWTRGGTCVPRQPRPGHSVQDPRPGRGETAQSAILPGTARSDFAEKMAEVLCVYRQVRILKQAAAVSKKKLSDAMAMISYDEKPGIQAIATTAPDLPPEPGVHATFAREHEYKRHGTISLLAGIHLVTGKVMRWSRIAIAAANSSNSSSFSTPPIRPTQRSS